MERQMSRNPWAHKIDYNDAIANDLAVLATCDATDRLCDRFPGLNAKGREAFAYEPADAQEVQR
jgi:hypothetical protein